jgi:hypothetical protein
VVIDGAAVIRTAASLNSEKQNRRKIDKSNTMSIELPYDVVHHETDVFEDSRTIV